jgi:hypothetical protein
VPAGQRIGGLLILALPPSTFPRGNISLLLCVNISPQYGLLAPGARPGSKEILKDPMLLCPTDYALVQGILLWICKLLDSCGIGESLVLERISMDLLPVRLS